MAAVNPGRACNQGIRVKPRGGNFVSKSLLFVVLGIKTVPPDTLRLVTTARMSFSEPLVWSGISGRPSTRNKSAFCLRRQRSRWSSNAKPVTRLKIRSNRARVAAARLGCGLSR